jgi:hypothetical protein
MKPLTVQDLVQEIESSSEQAPSPLGHLTAAVVAAERLSDMGDALVDHFVRRAREEGFSWAEVGQCMGVTKQAAQKRFVSERPDAHARQQDFLTEFAPSAAATVGLAGEEAVRLGHSYIGTEHLLLGLLRARDGVAARVLAAAGVDLESGRAEAERIVGRGKGGPLAGPVPLTPRSKKALPLALQECRHRGGTAPDTADVLIGLLREGKGVGAQILTRLAGDLTTLREQMVAAQS